MCGPTIVLKFSHKCTVSTNSGTDTSLLIALDTKAQIRKSMLSERNCTPLVKCLQIHPYFIRIKRDLQKQSGNVSALSTVPLSRK